MSAAENSLRADLEAAMAEHAEPVEKVEVEKPEVVETAPEADKQERARDEKGRFVAKAEQEPNPEPRGAEPVAESQAPAASGKGEAGVTTGQDGAAPGTEQALAPPNGWTAQAKAVWHTLPRDVQEAAIQREKDIAKFTSKSDDERNFGREVQKTIAPYLATIHAEGGTPIAAIQSLLNTAYILRTGSAEHKKQLLLQTARQFGVDLGAPQNGQQPTNTPPEFAALQQRIDQLEGMLAQREQAAHQQLQSEVQSEIEAFAADPKHSHYQEVKAHMAALLREGVAKDLQDAYDQATWARPDLRATLLAQQRAEEEQKRQAEAKARAEEKRRKSISITGGPGNTAAASAPGGRSIREELQAAMAASSGAV